VHLLGRQRFPATRDVLSQNTRPVHLVPHRVIGSDLIDGAESDPNAALRWSLVFLGRVVVNSDAAMNLERCVERGIAVVEEGVPV